MEMLPNYLCSRCGSTIEEPMYVCENGHLACSKCSKVFCQMCRHLFVDRSREISSGELNIPFSKTLLQRGIEIDPFQPNDGSIVFGEPFPLPKRGLCRFYASMDDQQIVFNWKINPNAGIIEVDVFPKERVNINWFIVEFSLPSNVNKKLKKEWAVNHRLHLNYAEVELFYEEDVVMCSIQVQEVPYGSVVKPFENKIKDAIISIFKSKRSNSKH